MLVIFSLNKYIYISITNKLILKYVILDNNWILKSICKKKLIDNTIKGYSRLN